MLLLFTEKALHVFSFKKVIFEPSLNHQYLWFKLKLPLKKSCDCKIYRAWLKQKVTAYAKQRKIRMS